jgi:hypothetical protein
MEFRRMGSEFGSRRFRDAARKLLGTPDSSAVNNTYVCSDVKSGGAVSCQNPHTLVIIVAGMGCMMFLVTLALLLLCWSVVRQRRIERERREANGGESPDQTSSSITSAATAALPPVDSPEFDDAVLVQLPGDEKPQFFALPKPFLADALHKQDFKKSTTEVAIKIEEKDPSSGDPISQNADSEHDPANPNVEDACVPSSDGHLHNPLFAPR